MEKFPPFDLTRPLDVSELVALLPSELHSFIPDFFLRRIPSTAQTRALNAGASLQVRCYAKVISRELLDQGRITRALYDQLDARGWRP